MSYTEEESPKKVEVEVETGSFMARVKPNVTDVFLKTPFFVSKMYKTVWFDVSEMLTGRKGLCISAVKGVKGVPRASGSDLATKDEKRWGHLMCFGWEQ